MRWSGGYGPRRAFRIASAPGGKMLDHSPVVLTDAEGVIRFWSAGAETAFGYAAIEAVGQTLDLIVPAEYSDAHWAGFRRAMAAGAAAEGQINPFPVRRADGA